MIDEQIEQLEHTLDVVSSTHRHDLTIDTSRKLLAFDPSHKLANHHIILAFYYSQKYDEMFAAIQSALQYWARESWIHYDLYLYYLYQGGEKYLKAKEHIEKAIELDPTHAHYYRSLGELYLINREADKAAEHLKTAVDLEPTFAEYRSRYALALLRQHKVRESLQMADQALKDGTDEDRIYDTVGMIYTLAGELDKGEELFREALRRMPTYDYFQKHIDWVLREKLDREIRVKQGKGYTPLYLRQKGANRFF